MSDFPRWKYWLVLVVLLAGAIYALPNLFPPQPAVQISANRSAPIDQALKEKVQGALAQNKIPVQSISIGNDLLMTRFDTAEQQLKASDALRDALGDKYVVALNQASTVPQWLRDIHANAMPLGLDLRGGVHFLMKVDQQAVVQKQEQRYLEDVRAALRNAHIRYKTVQLRDGKVHAQLNSDSDRDKAYAAITSSSQDVDVENGSSSDGSFDLVVSIKPERLRAIGESAIQQNLGTLRNRVNALGVAEPIIQQQGEDHIVVELAGVQDTAQAKKIIGATATLEYRAGDPDGNPLEAERTGKVPPQDRLYHMRDGRPVLLKKKVIVTGDELVDAASGFDQQDGSPKVDVTLNAAGARKMLDFTRDSVGKPMAVVFVERTPEVKTINGKDVRSVKVTEEVISYATVQGVFGKKFQTSGLDSPKEAAELALLLKAGSLAAPMVIVSESVIGPSMGQDNINKGFRAILLGLAIVVIFMIVYYKLFGLVADLALVMNLVLLIAVLSMFQATLTMPGIAGIVLTMGMAVDANVLICERIRDELRAGSTPLAAIRTGYEKAWDTILDANVTTLIAALALLTLGSGPIKGFGITLFIGILTSMFSAVTGSHAMIALIHGRRKLKTLSV
ncbi:MAG: protein translocase subunit SecD [Rhodanobacteraceae bacterium]